MTQKQQTYAERMKAERDAERARLAEMYNQAITASELAKSKRDDWRGGWAVSQLPDKWKADAYNFEADRCSEARQGRPMSATLLAYVLTKYRHGYRKGPQPIIYNPEWIPESQKHAINPDRYRWVESPGSGLRKAGNADDLSEYIDHKGWYTRPGDYDETVHGEVYQLPGKDGQARYVPAVNDPDNDAAVVDFHSVTDDKEECARWADSMAESWAEQCREDNAKADAEQAIEEIGEEISKEYADFRDTVRKLRTEHYDAPLHGVVRELVQAEWKRTRATIEKLRARRKRIERDGIDSGKLTAREYRDA